MGRFNFNLLQKLLNENYQVAIETGTFQGHGTLEISKYFNNVFTIEINENLYKNACEKFKDNGKINCVLGNSSVKLIELAQNTIIKNSNVLFWLDAHWSGNNSVDWNKSRWKGYGIDTGYIEELCINGVITSKAQVPLEEEILNIYNNYKNECLIYIDDFDKIDFETLKGKKNVCFNGEDWSHIDLNELFKKIDDRIVEKINVNNKQFIMKLKSISI